MIVFSSIAILAIWSYLFLPYLWAGQGIPMEIFNIFITVVIAFFAEMEGLSTYRQYRMEAKRLEIEDLRNELEKAYGIIFACLEIYAQYKENELWLQPDKKDEIESVIDRYPWIFPNGIRSLWGQVRGINLPTNAQLNLINEFRNKIEEEYNRRVKKYNELVKGRNQ